MSLLSIESPGSAHSPVKATTSIPQLALAHLLTMFATKLILATVSALSAVYIAGAVPTGLTPREDWKTALGWNGKVTTPVELDPSNAVRPIPGKPAPATVNGGAFFCKDPNFVGACAYVNGFDSGDCVNVGSEYNDVVSSFGTDIGITCTIFSDVNCKGRSTGGIVYPGIYNLADYNIDNSMSSFRCVG